MYHKVPSVVVWARLPTGSRSWKGFQVQSTNNYDQTPDKYTWLIRFMGRAHAWSYDQEKADQERPQTVLWTLHLEAKETGPVSHLTSYKVPEKIRPLLTKVLTMYGNSVKG